MKRLLFTLSLLFSLLIVKGQEKTIWLKDAKTKESIPFAHIMIGIGDNTDSLLHFLSDKDGMIKYSISENCFIHISYVGYETIIDSIYQEETRTFYLEPDVFNLEAYVVTANCAPQKVDKSIYKIQVISSKEIVSKGANNLTDLLNSELNMRISNDAALGSSVSLQGLSGEHIKVLIDGVPVVGRKNGNIDLSQIDLSNVDHIEIIEGPMSVVYGSNALAGVINIITKENKTALFSSQITSYLETVGVYNFNGSASVRKKKNYFGISAGRNFFDGFTTTPELRSMQWKPKRQINGSIDYGYNTAKQNLKLSASIFDELLQDKGNLLAPYYEAAFDQYFYTTRTDARGDYVLKMKNSKQLSIIASYSYYNWRKNTYLKDLTTLNQILSENPDQHDTTIVISLMSRGIYSKESPSHSLNYQIGYDINKETATGKRILSQSQTIGDYASFINVKYSSIRNLILQPGLRYGYNTKYTAPLIYSLNAHYRLNGSSFRASFARGFRAPSIKELYLDFHDVNHNINGNENLKAEYSMNYSISANTNFKKKDNAFSLKASAFYNDIENIITLALLENGSYTYTNLETYITKGFDIGLKYSFYPRINLGIAYGNIGIYNSTAAKSDSRDFLYSSNVSLNTEYLIPKIDVNIAAFYKYNGVLPQIIIDENGNLEETYISSYNLLDISFSKKFFKNSINISMGAKNLFNNTVIPSSSTSTGGTHTSGGDLPIGWGRTLFIQFSYSFKKY